MTHGDPTTPVGTQEHDCGHGTADGRDGGRDCRDVRDLPDDVAAALRPGPPAGPGRETWAGTIAVAATGPGPDDLVDEHFGRAAYLQLVDLATLTHEPLPNAGNRQGHHGAGPSTAELVATHDVRAVVAMRLGPKAVDAFRRAGIPVHGAARMSVADAVAAFVRGELPRLDV